MPGGNKEGGGLESTYKMKNSMLRKGAKHGAPVQMNYGSPAKGLYDNIKAGVSAAVQGARYGLGAAYRYGKQGYQASKEKDEKNKKEGTNNS